MAITKLLLARFLKERSLIEIERKTGIHLTRLCDIDAGRVSATDAEKKAISRVLGFSIYTIFPEEGKSLWAR